MTDTINNSKVIKSMKLEFSDSFRDEEIDLNAVLETFAGKKSILKITRDITLSNFDEEMEELENSIENKDFDKIVFNSHKMKSYISTFSTNSVLYNIFKEIEIYADEYQKIEDLEYLLKLFETARKQSIGFKSFLERIDFDNL